MGADQTLHPITAAVVRPNVGILLGSVVFTNVTDAASVKTLNDLLVNAPTPYILFAVAETAIDVVFVILVSAGTVYGGIVNLKVPVVNILPLISLNNTFVKSVSLLLLIKTLSIVYVYVINGER